MKDINVLKKKLANSFAKNEFGATKKILDENNKRREKSQIDIVSG